MVLLKNDGTLPLKSSVKNIAVVGPLADSMPALEGNYNGTSSHYVTPMDGIRKQFPSAEVTYKPGRSSCATPVPAWCLSHRDGKPGLTAVYFNNKDLSGSPAATRVEAQIGAGGSAVSAPVCRRRDGLARRSRSGRFLRALDRIDHACRNRRTTNSRSTARAASACGWTARP